MVMSIAAKHAKGKAAQDKIFGANAAAVAAAAKYGKDAQIKMAIEEMSELTQALCKDFRGKANADIIAEEIADVEIMIQQLQIIFNNRNDVSRFYELKIKRLKNNLRKEQK